MKDVSRLSEGQRWHFGKRDAEAAVKLGNCTMYDSDSFSLP